MTASANVPRAFGWDKNHLHLHCVIQTKSGRDEIVGFHGSEIKIRITEAPQNGKANKHLLRFLSRQFNVKKSDVLLLKGLASSHKLLRIRNPKILPPLFNQ